jgi:hypothetical protein
MNIYRYIAENNPDASYNLCMQNGDFLIESMDELELALQSIVAMGEEQAIKVLDLHPDKDVITEIFAKSITPAEANKVVPQVVVVEPKKECSCNKLNATGDTPTQQNHSIVTQTNTYILLGALIVSMAIISIKK